MKSEYEPDASTQARQIASGQCGDNITWNFLHKEGKLTVSGKGGMAAYPAMDFIPWARLRPYIRQACIGEGITDLCDYAFADCQNLAKIQLGKNISGIGQLAFYNCKSLVSIHIPAMTKSIGINAFSMCQNLEHIHVDENNTNYHSENGVLFDKKQTTLIQFPAGKTGTTYVIPDCVKYIGHEAFINCIHQTTIILPDGLTEIGNYAFLFCKNLESMDIPQKTAKIGENVFLFCERLKQITVRSAMPPIITEMTFSRQLPIQVPGHALPAYQASPIWSKMQLHGMV